MLRFPQTWVEAGLHATQHTDPHNAFTQLAKRRLNSSVLRCSHPFNSKISLSSAA